MTPKTYSEKVLDEHRHVWVEGSAWWRPTYAAWKIRMKEVGFSIDRVQFSGFYCQGDGASFTGTIEDFPKFLDAHFPDDFHVVRALDKEGLIYFAMRPNYGSHYNHEYSVCADCQYTKFSADSGEPVRDACEEVWNAQAETEVDRFESEATKVLRDHMRVLYRDLEEVYEDLTSDERVTEWLQSADILPEDELA